MKQIFLLIVLVFGCFCSYGQWNSMGLEPIEGEDYDGHNLQGGSYDNPTTILVTVNGQNMTDPTISSKFGYYIIGYYKFKKSWYYETVGDIIVTDLPVEDETNSINGTKVSFTETDYSSIHTTPEQWGMWETVGIMFDWSDFASGDASSVEDGTGFWEVIIVNKESGYCVSSGQITYQQEIKIDLVDPTITTPSSGPTLDVIPVLAGCWVNGATFDLTKGVANVNPSTATVKYYTDATCSALVADATAVPMPASNPATSPQIISYWAQAEEGGEKSDPKEIEVTVYQVPEATLSVNPASPICQGSEATFTATVTHGSVSTYEFFLNAGSWNSGEQLANTYTKSDFTAGGTVHVALKSGTSGACRDTADLVVDVTNLDLIAGGNLQITADKDAICEGESVELTASVVSGDPTGVSWVWEAPVPDADKNKAQVTVSPSSTQTYKVKALYKGCSTNLTVRTKNITVNPKPTLALKTPDATCGEKVDITQTLSGIITSYEYYSDAELTTSVPDITQVDGGIFYIVGKSAKGCTASSSITTIVNTLPVASIEVVGGEITEACSGSTISLKAGPTETGMAYKWGDGNTNQTISPVLATGNNEFKVTVTDKNGCTDTKTKSIKGNEGPTVAIDKSVLSDCSGKTDFDLKATVTLASGTLQQSLEWTGGTFADAHAANTTAALGDGANKFTLTVTDNNNCSGKDDITVIGNILTVKNITYDIANPITIGQTVKLTANATWNGSVDPSINYQWEEILPNSNILGTNKIQPVTPTEDATYEVTARKEGCEAKKSYQVTVIPDAFVVSNISVLDGKSLAVCEGVDLSANPVTLKVTAKGGKKPYQFNWNIPAGVTATPVEDSLLKITAIDYTQLKGGQTADISVDVSDATTPTPNAENRQVFFDVKATPAILIGGKKPAELQACLNVTCPLSASVDGVTNGVTYQWSGAASGTSDIVYASTVAVGTNTYKVEATHGGCTSEAEFDVVVNSLPDIALASQVAGKDSANVCPGTEITLVPTTSVTDPSYTWGGGVSGTFVGNITTTPTLASTTYSITVDDGKCKNTASITVKVFTIGTLAINADNTSICAGSDVKLTASGGSDYVWSGGSFAGTETGEKQTVTPDAMTTYYVDGKDTHGCPANQGSININVLNGATLVLAKSTLDGCEGTAVDLATAINTNLSTKGTKICIDGIEVSDTKVSVGKTYAISLKAGTCESEAKDVTVDFHALPNVTLAVADSKTEVCSGEGITLQATSTDSPLPTYTYAGNPGNNWGITTSNEGTSDVNTTYTVTAKNDHCSKNADVNVKVKALPNIEVTVPTGICYNNPVTLTASGAVSYVWNNNLSATGSTYIATPTSSIKSVTVKGTGANSCSRTKTVDLNPVDAPTLNMNLPLVAICEGQKIDLVTAVGPTGLNLAFYESDQTTSSVSKVEKAGTYYVQGQIGADGCKTEMYQIDVPTFKAKPSIMIGGEDVICEGSSTTLTFTGAASYKWNNVAVTDNKQKVTPTGTTSYVLTATGMNGCTLDSTVKIEVNPKPKLDWDASSKAITSVTYGSSITLVTERAKNTTAPYTYYWENDNLNSTDSYTLTAAANNPEKFAVCVTDGNNCTSDTLKKEVAVTPAGGALTVEIAVTNTEICNGGIQVLTAKPNGGTPGYAYKWYKDGVELSDETQSVLTVTDAATYKVELTDNGAIKQTADASQKMTVNAGKSAPEVMVVNMTIPAYNSTTLISEVKKGSGNYNYFWSPSDKLEATNVAYPKTKMLSADQEYKLYVTDKTNGCISKTASGTVKIDDANGFIVTVEASQTIICQNSEATLTAKLSGNVPEEADLTYLWMPSDNLSDASVKEPVFKSSTAGPYTYYVKVSDKSGHTVAGSIMLTVTNNVAPILSLSKADDVSCAGETVLVLANGTIKEGSYSWVVNDGVPETGITSKVLTDAGHYKIKVTAEAGNGCAVAPVEKEYDIHDLPTIAWVLKPVSVEKGKDLTVEVAANDGAAGNYTYNWAQPDIKTTATGEYKITSVSGTKKTFEVNVKDNTTGCVSETITHTVQIVPATDPIIIETNVENALLCLGGSAVLDVTAVKGGAGRENIFEDYTYEWYLGSVLKANTQTYTVTDAGTYSIVVKDKNGKESPTKDITVSASMLNAPQVSDNSLTIVAGNQTYLYASVTGGTPDYNYYWSPASDLVSSANVANPQTVPLSADKDYTYYVTDANKCTSAVATASVHVIAPTDPAYFAATAIADRNTICNNNTVQLDVEVSRDLTNATYSWSPATGLSNPNIQNPVFTPTVAGPVTFVVKVEEQGGIAVTSAVTINVLNVNAPKLSLQDDGTCAGETLTVNNNGETVPDNGYSWMIDGTLDNTATGKTYALGAGLNQEVKVYATSSNSCTSDTVSGIFSRKEKPTLAWATTTGFNPGSVTEEDNFTMKVEANPTTGTRYFWEYVFTPKGGAAQIPETDNNSTSDEYQVIQAEEGVYEFKVYAKLNDCVSEPVLEQSVTVLPKGAALAVTTNKSTFEVCSGGAALVTATGHNGDNNYTFEWFKGTSATGTSVATGSTVLLSPLANGEKYVVKVTDGTSATAVSSPITLNFSVNTAPAVTDFAQTVAYDNSTILLSKVIGNTNPYVYHWTPDDKLGVGESGKANPQTIALKADQTYTYYVTDKNNCISKPGTVNVTVDVAPDAVVLAATTDKSTLCKGNEAHFGVKVTKGSLSNAATYQWTPNDGNLSKANIANPVFKSNIADTYEYTLTVTDKGKTMVSKVKVVVNSFTAPTLAQDPANPTTYTIGDPLTMKVKASDGKAGYTYYWLKPGTKTEDAGVGAGQYDIAATTDAKYDYQVYVQDANMCMSSDTLEFSISGAGASTPIEVEVENQTICAGEALATLTATVTSGQTVDYQWTNKGNTLPLSNDATATVSIDLSSAVAGTTYNFEVTVTEQGKAENTETKEVSLAIQAGPTVQINEEYLALHKDGSFVLNVVNPTNYDYLWTESVYDMTKDKWSDPVTKGSANTLNGDMADQDIRYILSATEKSGLKCKAYDTAYIYRIPNAPALAIDTNNNRLTIRLDWGTVAGADDYTVWSRKWDPYCMTSEDGQKYASKTTTTANMWGVDDESDMDTLEFYYVTANRNIHGVPYYSHTSDTVGYYLYDVKRNTGAFASINYYPVYFEMKGVGVHYKTKDMFALYGNAITLIKKWNFSTQLWEAAQKLPNGVVANDFDIVVGTLLQLDPKAQTRILQYGVLPNGLSALLARTNTGSKANISHSYMWTHRLDLTNTKDFLTEFTGVSLIKYWDFSSQLWVASQMLPNGVVAKRFDLKGLMPLQIELKSGVTTVNWK